MKVKLPAVLIALIFVFNACKTVQPATENADENAKRSSVTRAHLKNREDFTTLQARLGVAYSDENRSQRVTVDLRMQKGEVIWMSARFLGITMAKVKITPDRVQFYEKLNKRGFDGDFRIIAEYLGEPLNFQQIEDILLGHAMEDLDGAYDFSIEQNAYRFTREGMIARLIQLRPDNFKVDRQQLFKKADQSSLSIVYSDYQKVEGRTIPEEINIDAIMGEDHRKVELDYNSVEFDQKLSFPFSFPGNIEIIQL